VIIRKLKTVGHALDSITTRNNLAQFLNDTENAQKLNDLVGDIRDALMAYQVCIPKPLALIISDNGAPDFVTTRYLRRELPNCEPLSPTTQPYILTCKQGVEDHRLLQDMHHAVEAGYQPFKSPLQVAQMNSQTVTSSEGYHSLNGNPSLRENSWSSGSHQHSNTQGSVRCRILVSPSDCE
jgi:hypothetical protein